MFNLGDNMEIIPIIAARVIEKDRPLERNQIIAIQKVKIDRALIQEIQSKLFRIRVLWGGDGIKIYIILKKPYKI